MRRIASLGLCCALLGLFGAWPAHAAIELNAAHIVASGVEAQGVHLQLAPDPAHAGVFVLRLQVAALAVPALGWKQVAVSAQGDLQRDAQGRWLLSTPLQVRGAPGRALAAAHLDLSLDPRSDTAVLRIVQGATQLDAALPMDTPLHVQLQLNALPLAWLGGALAAASPGAKLSNGTASGMLALDADGGSVRVSGNFGVEGLAAFTAAGSVAAQGLGLRGAVDLRRDDGQMRLGFDGALRGGELLAGSFYTQLPPRAVPLRLRLTRAADGALRVSQFRLQDNGTLDVDGSAALAADGAVQSLHVAAANMDLARAIPRYASTWLQSHGFAGLQAMGQARLALDWQRGTLSALRLDLQHVDVADTAGRFAVAGLDGSINWRQDATLPASTLGWRALSVYRVPLGAARFDLRDDQGLLRLQRPVSIPLLAGSMRVQHLAFDPAGTRRTRLSTGLAFTGVSLGELSGALGWPAFRGQLGGAIPDLRLQGGRVELQGGLSLNVFGGYVDVTRMSVAHLFGSAPQLGADLSLRGIELAPLTRVFDFGEITGKLDGRIQDVRLLDWRPVAFKAALSTSGGGRISQRAVNNLTSVGGGGLAGGLQGALLRLFSTFPYKRIALSCTLADNVCTMGGLRPASGGGYTIVEGDGLPYIHIIGHETRVDWSTLVSRLKAATTGQRPVIR